MAEAEGKLPKPPRKAAPFVVAGVGVVAVFFLYRWYTSSVAAGASAAATGTSDGQTTPGDTTVNGAMSTSTPTDLAGWIQTAIGAMTSGSYSTADALNDLTAWQNGSCVSSAGAKAIGNVVTTLGLPTGTTIPNQITVCANNTTSSGGASAANKGTPFAEYLESRITYLSQEIANGKLAPAPLIAEVSSLQAQYKGLTGSVVTPVIKKTTPAQPKQNAAFVSYLQNRINYLSQEIVNGKKAPAPLIQEVSSLQTQYKAQTGKTFTPHVTK